MPPGPTFQEALGQAVRERRRILGMTQEDLALRAEPHQRWISNVERCNPSYGSLRRLADGLDMKASALLVAAEAMEHQ